MFVALKNWRERLAHRGGASGDRLLATTELALARESGSDELLRHFRTAAHARPPTPPGPEALEELGPQFDGSEPLTPAENLSIMASVERGAARQKRRN
jgi:hypothetical protein